jgi:hypothetical protein
MHHRNRISVNLFRCFIFKMKAARLILKIFLVISVTVALTIMTQVGGVIYLASLLLYPFINRFRGWWIRLSSKLIAFIILYVISTLLLIPPLAKQFGRVPLPVIGNHHVQPAVLFTALANRNYVKPELKKIVYSAAEQLNQKYPGSKMNYLDASFPFFDGFRLWPHLSHNDGRKLDLSFQYDDSKTQVATSSVPSFIGYGSSEDPEPGEDNMPLTCSLKGYWQYSLLTHLVSQKKKQDFIVNVPRTKTVIETLAQNKEIVKIYIEPHLKIRWKIRTDKIRFHGCQAVRHDDHIHVQIRAQAIKK